MVEDATLSCRGRMHRNVKDASQRDVIGRSEASQQWRDVSLILPPMGGGHYPSDVEDFRV
jgi:hypothetical protein